MGAKADYFMREALNLASAGIRQRHGGPFGAVVVIGDEIVGRGWNQVVVKNDPTAHAEMLAIRDACTRLGHFNLNEATLYTSCEPCPMCLSAAYWARIDAIVYAADANDAAAIGFDDRRIKQVLQQPLSSGDISFRQMMQGEARQLLQQWEEDPEKTRY
jgi:tRNA(Arg) A34 adenosine deaminase TadA